LSYLFIDSTYELSLGVLDDGLNWLVFESHGGGQKASAIIQARSYELLSKFKLNPKELTGIIIVNGPGFYTGLRLAEGFADVFTFFGVKQFSLYSYEIPLWCGHEAGTWFTKAYRGEYFYYHWDNSGSKQELLSVKEIEKGLKGQQIFIHSRASMDAVSSALISRPIETTDLLQKHSKEIFSQVINNNLKRESFYFRAPEDEFKVNP
jgi:tRNA threonylcarbamoyladenosine biosynthesis protein TsaB